ncbi:PQQ-dependent sugar dehydrogenase [Chelativorans sp. Marseille-P2723]|uniref:PQQ-dependent sugar dehydrogenase n=1 Tax=Chelativorans sp. Marseille-P2723 TaxID=2709133 RepID=UPI001570ADE2|nr:PQQ-dependent sugar dehydrogenase [Chelativorans sp. Marseille-P2723]
MSKSLLLASSSIALFLASSAFAVDEVFDTEETSIRVTTLADGLAHPWALALLPDGTMLVTERPGRLRHVSRDGQLSEPVAGVPEVDARGQGGLLDVAIDPDFQNNRLVYLSFAEAGEGGNGTAVARGRLSEDMTSLSGVKVIFRQQPKQNSTAHFGSRLVFDEGGYLFVTLGERSSVQFRGQAQELNSHLGKIVRIHPDGSVPGDNPFVGQEGALPEIWSYGHRNIQAAAINPQTGVLWEIEHGPRGGDELNIVQPGANYGWPIVSLGINYDGSPVGEGIQQAEGMVDPSYSWTPVIAPSGMIFYQGAAFPEWRGNLFVGGLASTALVRLELNGNAVASEERLLEALGLRIRDVAEGPGGEIFVVTDQRNGEILRITPAG